MATQHIARRSAMKPNSSGGKENAAPVYCDKDDSKLKFVPGGAGSITEYQVVDAVQLTGGSGISAAETYKTSVTREGNVVTTKILVDLTGLVGSGTDLDIIGNTGGAANCHFGQLTVAINGTFAGGKITCLELPTGGADDIDFYSSDVATGAQDVIITNAALGTETALVTSGAAWASGTTKGFTGAPNANDYIYVVNGEAAGGTFTAGKFLIEIYGTLA